MSRQPTDEFEITQLQYRYGRGVATRDVETVVSCFADDAHLTYDGVPPIDGIVAIRSFFAANLGPGGSTSSHNGLDSGVSTPVITNVLVDTEGDTATATSTCLAIHAGSRDGRETVLVRGTENLDDLVRVGTRWKISRRAHRLLWSFSTDGTVHTS